MLSKYWYPCRCLECLANFCACVKELWSCVLWSDTGQQWTSVENANFIRETKVKLQSLFSSHYTELTTARFTLQKIFCTARVKLARVPKKSSANFVYTTPFLPYQKYRARVSSLVDMRSSIIIKNVRVILVENEQPS